MSVWLSGRSEPAVPELPEEERRRFTQAMLDINTPQAFENPSGKLEELRPCLSDVVYREVELLWYPVMRAEEDFGEIKRLYYRWDFVQSSYSMLDDSFVITGVLFQKAEEESRAEDVVYLIMSGSVKDGRIASMEVTEHEAMYALRGSNDLIGA